MEMSFEDMSELDDLTINRLRLASFLAKAGFSSIEDRKRLMRRERKVLRFYDNETYSKFFLGLDSIGNGVTFGGVRLLEPGKEKEAMRDAMRLSEAMTHKLSMIDEPFGGSKLVVIPPQSGKSDALLQRIGEYVELMQGQFITAIDFGFEPGDALKIRKETKFILGFEGPESIGASGVTTATGAFFGMPVILKEVFGSAIAEGRSFAIQGLGSVGNELAKLLLKAGGRLFVSEPDADKLKPFENIPKVTIVDPNDLLSVKVDVLCPCGPACVLNPITIPKLGAKAVAGVANCVLEDEKRDDILLMKKGILFAPDFVLNAGGV
ncbi:MAG: hypothetical protein NTY68_03045, partial [Candidatus Micrarchaeota archaeon]|nr:hypothetical protein [Candidatus Micrarchaeota archaeon]